MPRRKLARRSPPPNPSALGWVGIGLGVAAAAGLVFTGVVFYRLTRL